MVVSHEVLSAQLKNQRAEILAELEELAEHPSYKLGLGNHQADDASAAFDQAANLALRQNAERLLALIDQALERMDAGTYGYCVTCGDPIDPARLKALPYAPHCFRCAEHH